MGVKVREKKKGSGEWWIFIDHNGTRKAKKIGRDRKLANEIAKKIDAKLVLGDTSLLKPKEQSITFKEYASQWLEGYVNTALKRSTHRGYKSIIDKHLNPRFGGKLLSEITRHEIKQFLFSMIRNKRNPKGLSYGRIKRIKAVLSGLFTQAIEDSLLHNNPASRLDRFFNSKDQALDNEIKPYKADELELYLETAEAHFPEYYPFLLTLARSGLRLGEALGIKWSDIDFNGCFINIRRGIVEGELTTTKFGKTRAVQMTPMLSKVLQQLKTRRKEQKLQRGWEELPEWVFVNSEGSPIDQGNFRGRVHYRVCEKAGLRRIRIHDLRHSYATIRISAGHNIADVSRQLGHASIKITIDTYYHWLPSHATGEIDQLDQIGRNHNQTQPIRN